MGKHSKPAKPKGPGLLRILWLILCGAWIELKIKVKAKVRAALGPREIARASEEVWEDGVRINLRPMIQPYTFRHYVAPEDMERYSANIGGYEFEFELWPESGHELKQAAYDAAAEHFGPYVDSQPLYWLDAANENARAVLPAPLTI